MWSCKCGLAEDPVRAAAGRLSDYRLYALLAPHLANCGMGNTGWAGDYKGIPMLFAERNDCALAFACSAPWRNVSVGFAGFSDGWQDLSQHFQLTWRYTRAENGNIALTGEIDLGAGGGECVLALGFGGTSTEAGSRPAPLCSNPTMIFVRTTFGTGRTGRRTS
jgi:glucoamylase